MWVYYGLASKLEWVGTEDDPKLGKSLVAAVISSSEPGTDTGSTDSTA